MVNLLSSAFRIQFTVAVQETVLRSRTLLGKEEHGQEDQKQPEEVLRRHKLTEDWFNHSS